MQSCSVWGCAGADRNEMKMFMVPMINNQTESFQKLSKQRRNAWLTAIGKTTSDPKSWEKLQVCDNHFISGKMAALQDIHNMDWVPTMNLRYPRDSKSKILRCSVADCVVSNQGGQCSFYRISKDMTNGKLNQISELKLSAWITALGLRDVVPATSKNIYVCHAHYMIDMRTKQRKTLIEEATNLDTGGSVHSYETFVCDTKPADNVMTSAAISRTHNRMSKFHLMSPNRIVSISTKDKMSFSKSGNILRNENGRFSFSCCYCNAVNDDCHAMMNHINTHFDKTLQTKKSVSPEYLPSPEFVSCTITDNDTEESEFSETFQELTNTITESKPPHKDTTFTISAVKTELVPSLKRPLSPTINIKDLLVSRPCNIKIVKTMDVVDATPTTKLPTKFKPIQIPPLPAEFAEKLKLSNNSHSRRSGVISKGSNATGKITDETVHLICTPEVTCDQSRLEPAVGESDPRQHMCQECEECFPDHITYRTHFLERHQCQILRCYQCEMEPSISNESDPRRHRCAMCKDWFPNHNEFRTHLKDIHDEYVTDNDFNCFANDYREFNCYICEKTLKQREYLVCHVKGHFEKYLEYQCHLCGLRTTKGALKQHMKRHDITPTECDLCNKTFSNSLRMRKHRLCHTHDLKHICPLCKKGFKLRKYLSRHMAVHKETKISCRYCDATFTFSTGRRAHEKIVHNVL
ncbi:transcription factor E4F1-like [Bradysia coprophila]|uniref:transcription factor E4F1-like n=1 Tax=Bradysia coprophila TaxID=38358 RepID=UPI00187D9A2E|nr:transcription factor E4F1-like [Bradysia coprophila]